MTADAPPERSILRCYLLLFTLVGWFWWLAATNKEMRGLLHEQLPSAAWMLIPGANLWWLTRWASAAERMTAGEVHELTAFFFPWYAIGHVQAALNKVARETPQLPAARVV